MKKKKQISFLVGMFLVGSICGTQSFGTLVDTVEDTYHVADQENSENLVAMNVDFSDFSLNARFDGSEWSERAYTLPNVILFSTMQDNILTPMKDVLACINFGENAYGVTEQIVIYDSQDKERTLFPVATAVIDRQTVNPWFGGYEYSSYIVTCKVNNNGSEGLLHDFDPYFKFVPNGNKNDLKFLLGTLRGNNVLMGEVAQGWTRSQSGAGWMGAQYSLPGISLENTQANMLLSTKISFIEKKKDYLIHHLFLNRKTADKFREALVRSEKINSVMDLYAALIRGGCIVDPANKDRLELENSDILSEKSLWEFGRILFSKLPLSQETLLTLKNLQSEMTSNFTQGNERNNVPLSDGIYSEYLHRQDAKRIKSRDKQLEEFEKKEIEKRRRYFENHKDEINKITQRSTVGSIPVDRREYLNNMKRNTIDNSFLVHDENDGSLSAGIHREYLRYQEPKRIKSRDEQLKNFEKKEAEKRRKSLENHSFDVVSRSTAGGVPVYRREYLNNTKHNIIDNSSLVHEGNNIPLSDGIYGKYLHRQEAERIKSRDKQFEELEKKGAENQRKLWENLNFEVTSKSTAGGAPVYRPEYLRNTSDYRQKNSPMVEKTTQKSFKNKYDLSKHIMEDYQQSQKLEFAENGSNFRQQPRRPMIQNSKRKGISIVKNNAMLNPRVSDGRIYEKREDKKKMERAGKGPLPGIDPMNSLFKAFF